MNVQQYFKNLWLALLGKTPGEGEVEAFDVGEIMRGAGVIVIIPMVLLTLLYSVGAALLSYHYNVYMGNSQWGIFWAIGAYLFSGLYYPYYAFFVDPLPTLSPVVGASVASAVSSVTGSGRRRNK
jgi:hypothetical protein